MMDDFKISVDLENKVRYGQYIRLKQTTESHLQEKGFLPIDAPVLAPALIPESYLEVFETQFRFGSHKQSLYLTPSPELFMKRLIAQGVGNCYYLGKAFRNEEPNSTLHSPEFTMLEFYKLHADYMDIVAEVLLLFQSLAVEIFGKPEIVYGSQTIDLKSWEKLSVTQAFHAYSSIPEEVLFDEKLFLDACNKKGLQTKGFTYEDLFSQLYAQEIEPHLGMNGKPTLLYDYPKQMAALAKLNSDGKTAQRFEVYIGGIELGDCYSELIDWKEQEERFTIESRKRKESGKIDHAIDKDYIKTLQYGLEVCAGIAIGFERLAMVFLNASSIHDLRLINVKTI